jgi:hypothetical protein
MKSASQSILEYVVIIGVVSAALATMQLYLRRSVQAVVKATADQIGTQANGVAGGDLDYHYERKRVGDSVMDSEATGYNNTSISIGGNISHSAGAAENRSGVLQYEVTKDKF